MQIYPSREQRLLLFENNTYRRDSTQIVMREFMSGRSGMSLSPELHCICDGDVTVLFSGATLTKIRGGRSLKALFDALRHRSEFDFPTFNRAALLVGNPEYVLEQLLERGFLISSNACSENSRRCHEPGPDESPVRLFIRLSDDPTAPHLYHFNCPAGMRPRSAGAVNVERLLQTLTDCSGLLERSGWEAVVLFSLGDDAPPPELLRPMLQSIGKWRAAEEKRHMLRLIALTTVKGLAALADLDDMPERCTVYLSIESSCRSGDNERWREAGELMERLACRFGTIIPIVQLSEDDDCDDIGGFIRAASPEVIRLQLPFLTRRCPSEERAGAGRAMAEKAFRLFKNLRRQGIRETTIGSLALALAEETPRRSLCAYGGYDGPGGSWRTGMCYLSDFHAGLSGREEHLAPAAPAAEKGEGCSRECIALALCQGGCAFARSLALSGDGPQDIFHCSLLRHLTELILRDWISKDRDRNAGRSGAADVSLPSTDVKAVRELAGASSELLFEELCGGASLLGRSYYVPPFVFLISRRGYTALYHSLSLRKVFGGGHLESVFRKSRGAGETSPRSFPLGEYLELLSANGDIRRAREDLAMLIDLEMLVPEWLDPMEPLSRASADRIFCRHRIGLLYLLVSNECNLRCSYCSIECGERKPEHYIYSRMSPQTAQKGLSLFAGLLDSSVRSPQVIFYGGEPLLNWPAIEDSLHRIRDMEKEGLFNGAAVECSIVCNGTLVTPEIASQMRKLSLRASVSIDGLARHHDLYRRFRDGRGSWHEAVRGYRLLKDHLGECGISCTLGSHNLDDIEEIAEFFAGSLECRGLGFNLIKGLPAGNDLDVPSGLVTDKIIRAYGIFRRYGVYEDRITRKIRSFVDEEPWIFDCAGYGGQIALCADGVTGPCHIAADAHRFIWGHIDEEDLAGKIAEGSLTRQWCRRSPLLMQQCSDCIGLGICGGGCADEAFVKGGSIDAVDRAFCDHCRHLLEWMFDDLAAKMQESGALTCAPGRRMVKGV